MKRVFELREWVEDTALLCRLEAFLVRRMGSTSTTDIIPESEEPDEFIAFRVGNTYGRHRERILRREMRRNAIPEWFDPRVHPGQFAYISPRGLRVYVQTELNEASRNAPSVFETQILALVEPNPEALSLFGIVS